MTPAPRVLITPRSLTAGGLESVAELDPLREHGFELVSTTPGRLPAPDELLEVVPGCVGWLAGVEPIGEAILRRAPGLRVISRNGAGVDAIDLDAAARHGVEVLRAEGANAQGVAELALTLVLCALRDVPAASAALKRGEWRRTAGSELGDRTVGIVGLGEVGRRTAAMFTALGARVIAHDPYARDPAVPVLDLDEVLATADVISLSCPPPADGRPMIDAARLSGVKRGTVLVNTARSSLVDDDAVLAALEDGTLLSYAVDAFDTEPPEPSALLSHERVVATPHLGGFTAASVGRATSAAVANLLRVLEGE